MDSFIEELNKGLELRFEKEVLEVGAEAPVGMEEDRDRASAAVPKEVDRSSSLLILFAPIPLEAKLPIPRPPPKLLLFKLVEVERVLLPPFPAPGIGLAFVELGEESLKELEEGELVLPVKEDLSPKGSETFLLIGPIEEGDFARPESSFD